MTGLKKRYWYAIAVPVLCCAALAVIFAGALREVTAEGILEVLPDNLWLAALGILGLYALKSCSIIFPLAAIQIAAGVMYPFPVALLINLLGLAVTVTAPFLLGRVSSPDLQAAIVGRFPKVKRLADYQNQNEFMFCFLTRVVCPLPGDVVSWFMGTTPMHLLPFVGGTVLGKFTGMFVYTLVGNQLVEGLTWRLAVLYVVLVAFSYTITTLLNRLAKKRGVHS